MGHDARKSWNEIWSTMDESYAGADDTLVEQFNGSSPGRALELGCGTGGNAIWLAEQGWKLTAVDYSDVAIGKARERAEERDVSVDFVVADASTYQPDDQYDLVASFYIQLPSEMRKKMLAVAASALAPGGTLLFVSHDKSSPPSGWSDEDMQTLTTPAQIVAEIPGLDIELAYVKKEASGAPAHCQEPHEHQDSHQIFGASPDSSYESSSTIVIATKTMQGAG